MHLISFGLLFLFSVFIVSVWNADDMRQFSVPDGREARKSHAGLPPIVKDLQIDAIFDQ
jgi:hypothetical protein